METKSLLFGLVGFFLGGLLVSIAATTFDAPTHNTPGMTMTQMSDDLKNKQGDEYDKAFIAMMIDHHEGAIEMAKLSAAHARHDEIKKLSVDIISAQEDEIHQMKQWQADWGYTTEFDQGHMSH